jgi:hypothetical protein
MRVKKEKDEEKSSKDAKPTGEYRRYTTEVKLAEREFQDYIERCKKIVKRYRDEDRKGQGSDDLPARFNCLWSNTETLAPALYSRTPNVQVDRRFKDSDPVGRAACQIWERATQFALDNYDFDGTMRAVLKDYQLCGRGTAWIRYEPAVEDDGISYQEVSCDHVHYRDFGHMPAKQWRNVRGVWRKIYLTRKQLKQRFGKIGAKVPLDWSPMDSGMGRDTDDSKENKQACVYEYWDADNMRVVWFSKGYTDGLLDNIEDPLGLHDFFPTPKPLFGTTTTDSLIPIPDYALYQDQARELDVLTMKIALLEDAIRMVGFYDGTYTSEMNSLYSNPRTNEMIPIHNWQKLQAAGGMKGIAEWMSIKEIIEALSALYNARDKVKQDMYEITGVADVIRGASSMGSAPVTATERRIQGQFATLRLQDKQKDVERYARDLIALQGEVIAEHFEPEILAAMTGYDISQPDIQQVFMPAIQLLKNDPMRSFRISLETDSMIAVDDAYEKQQTNEFMQMFGQVMQGSMQAVMQMPVLAPMFAEAMLFCTRRFKAGRALETAIEQGMQSLNQMAQQSMSQPKQDPEVLKVQARAQLEQQDAQNKWQLSQAESQNKLALARDEMNQRMQLEMEKFKQEVALEWQKAAADIKVAETKAVSELKLKEAEISQKERVETRKAVLGAGIKDLHALPDGTLTTRPTIIKEGTFDYDAKTGRRKVVIIERPLEGNVG